MVLHGNASWESCFRVSRGANSKKIIIRFRQSAMQITRPTKSRDMNAHPWTTSSAIELPISMGIHRCFCKIKKLFLIGIHKRILHTTTSRVIRFKKHLFFTKCTFMYIHVAKIPWLFKFVSWFYYNMNFFFFRSKKLKLKSNRRWPIY